MNFDNKAVVINSKITKIKSINGSASCYSNRAVAPPVPFVTNSSKSCIYENISDVYKQDEGGIKNNAYVTGIKSFSTYILAKKHLKVEYEPSYAYILSSREYNGKYEYKENYKTCIFNYTYNGDIGEQKFYTRIIDKTVNSKIKSFPYVSALIKYEKRVTQIDITDHDNLSVVIQKNEYFEINTGSVITTIDSLPKGIKYTTERIYGTFSESGQYELNVQYVQGKQKIIINVPYYRRTL